MKNDVYRYYSYMLPPLYDARYKDALFIILSFGKFQGPVTDDKEEQIMRKKNTACFLSQVCHAPSKELLPRSLVDWMKLAQEQLKVDQIF